MPPQVAQSNAYIRGPIPLQRLASAAPLPTLARHSGSDVLCHPLEDQMRSEPNLRTETQNGDRQILPGTSLSGYSINTQIIGTRAQIARTLEHQWTISVSCAADATILRQPRSALQRAAEKSRNSYFATEQTWAFVALARLDG